MGTGIERCFFHVLFAHGLSIMLLNLKLKNIYLKNFRNIEEMKIEACDSMNVIYGDNAQGKTNLIEAIWLFTGNQSFRGSKLNEFVQFEKDFSKIEIEFLDVQRVQKASITLGERKKITLNSVEVKTSSELNGNFYAVVFSPAHLSFIKDGPKNRRKFIDIAVSQIKPQYKNYLLTYEKLVNQRNALLKKKDDYDNIESLLDVWDLQLAKIGTIISIFRNDYINKLRIVTKKIYEGLSNNQEDFDIQYVSTVFDDIKKVTVYDDKMVDNYYKKLKDSFSYDLKNGSTSVGIHRDDLDVFINEKSVKTYGSQGQQRSCVITLKLGEATLLKKVTKENPIMLFDDVMSELDEKRQDYILNHVKDLQVFITCCDVSNTLKLKNGCIFKIENGKIVSQEMI